MRFYTWLKNKIEILRKRSALRGFTCDCCGAEVFCYPCERLCENCKEELVRNDGLTCPKCGRKTLSNGVCLTCKSTMPKFTQAFSPFVYRGLPAKLINRLKNGNRRLAYLLGEETATYFLEKKTADLSGEPLLILPIPLTAERRIVRGYNQAEELAKVIAEKLNEGGMYATNDFETLIKRLKDVDFHGALIIEAYAGDYQREEELKISCEKLQELLYKHGCLE